MTNKNLIFEELSISKEVTTIGNELQQQIIENLNKVEGTYLSVELFKRVLWKETTLTFHEPIFGLITEINTQIVFFDNKKDYVKYFNHYPFGGLEQLNKNL